MIARRLVLALIALALGVGVAACGGGDDEAGDATTEETTTGEASTAAGKEVFAANCGSCHTLSDAGTTGTIGPTLDGSGLEVSAIEGQVRNGGGGMPAFEDQLSDEEIEAVSAYVAEAGG